MGVKETLPTCDKVIVEELDPKCVYCKTELENSDHLFFKCEFSAEVWKGIRRWMGLRREMTTIKATVKWLFKEDKGKSLQSVGRRTRLAASWWNKEARRRSSGLGAMQQLQEVHGDAAEE
ncbi:uncharacterized protein LOC131160842 [Malania oleifera]|uniref:uncharacterized protein LOC131160842 n=1 Tax=Malania oleifera TaxID=397392 RepID=UPI0025AE9165|nr:uncharacterized protein LOC131160842 [Malania oleifera]